MHSSKQYFKITWRVIRWLTAYPVHSTNQIPRWSCLAGVLRQQLARDGRVFIFQSIVAFLCSSCAHHQLHFPLGACFLCLLSRTPGNNLLQILACPADWLTAYSANQCYFQGHWHFILYFVGLH